MTMKSVQILSIHILIHIFIDINEPILATTEKYKRHSSIVKRKKNTKIQNHVCYKHVTSEEINEL